MQSFCRHESDLHTLVERLGDALEHGERVPLVIGVLQPADGGFGGAHPVGQLLLRKASFGPKLVNLPRDLGVDDLLFVFTFALGVARDVAVVKKL